MVHFFFHFQASTKIGLGHAIRCLSLAQTCLSQGHVVYLLVNEATENAITERIDTAVKVILFDPLIPEKSKITFPKRSILVTDNYALGIEFEMWFKGKVKTICAIDDLADRVHYCDFLLDQTVGCKPEKYAPLVPKDCAILAGPHFALLNHHYLIQKDKALEQRQLKPSHKKLLISFGGSDPDNVTGRVLSLLPNLKEITSVEIVLGSANPHAGTIKHIVDQSNLDINLHINLPNLSTLLINCDMAIGAGGISALERCVYGIPTLLIEIAENQKIMIQELQKNNAGISLGSPASLTKDRLDEALKRLLNSGFYSQMSKAAATLCDGEGSRRVINKLINSIEK